MKNAAYPIKPKRSRWKLWSIYIVLFLVYVWALSGVPLDGFKETAGQISKAIINGLFLQIGIMFIYLKVKIYYAGYLIH